MNIPSDIILKKLSKGNLQKVQLIQALAPERKYVFLDEPLTALDNESIDLIMDCIKTKINNGVMVLMTTHKIESTLDLNPIQLEINNHQLKLVDPIA